MHEWQSLSHVRWDCKYHIVIIPKYRKKKLYGKVKKHVGEVIREVCRQRGIELLEGHLMPDHIHMCVSIPPKHSVAFAIGFIKGKSAVRIHRQILGNKRVTGLHFWSRGYCVSTVGLDEETIKKYIRDQEALEKRQGELDFDN
jgi:putative transposase